MAIDKKAWYRRLHLENAMKQMEMRQKHGIPPLEGPAFMEHDDECEECALVRANGEQSKTWVKAHLPEPTTAPNNLNHGNKCPYCNTASLNEMTRNDHFGTGREEGR